MTRKLLLRYIKAVFLLFVVGLGCAVIAGVWIEHQIVIDLQNIFNGPQSTPTLVPYASIQAVRADITVKHENGTVVLAGEVIANFLPNRAMYVSVRGDASEQAYLWIDNQCYRRRGNDWAKIAPNSISYCTVFSHIHTFDDLLRAQGISPESVSQVPVPNSRQIIDAHWVDAYSVTPPSNPAFAALLPRKTYTALTMNVRIATDDRLPYKLEYSLVLQNSDQAYQVEVRFYDYNSAIRLTAP